MRVLALDVGSSSVKAACWDGRRFSGVVRAALRTRFEGRRAEVEAGDLLRAVMRAGAGVAAGRVDAIAFCAFSTGVVVTNQAGRATGPIVTHADRRSVETAAALVRARPKRWWLKRTGNLPYPGGIGSSTLAFLHERGIFARRGYRLGQVSTLIGWWLMGGCAAARWIIDPSNAAFLGLYDVQRGGWSEEVCAEVGISAASLPEIVYADSILGKLSHAVARRWQVPAGVPIIGGLIDTGATLLQTPMRPGQLVHSCGSTDVLAICLESPMPAEGILTRPIGVGVCYPERWLAVRTMAAAGSGLQWLRDTAFCEMDDEGWQRVLRQAARRLGEGDLPECVPAFAGARAAIAQPEGGSFAKLRLGTTRKALVAALMRALVNESVASYRRLVQIRRPLETVHVSGGASILGDAMHRAWPGGGRHRFRRVPGETLRGLAMLAEKVLESGDGT